MCKTYNLQETHDYDKTRTVELDINNQKIEYTQIISR